MPFPRNHEMGWGREADAICTPGQAHLEVAFRQRAKIAMAAMAPRCVRESAMAQDLIYLFSEGSAVRKRPLCNFIKAHGVLSWEKRAGPEFLDISGRRSAATVPPIPLAGHRRPRLTPENSRGFPYGLVPWQIALSAIILLTCSSHSRSFQQVVNRSCGEPPGPLIPGRASSSFL